VVSFVPTTRLSKTLLSSVPRYSFVGSVPVSLLPDLLSLLADILSSLKLGGSGVSVVPGVAPLGRGYQYSLLQILTTLTLVHTLEERRFAHSFHSIPRSPSIIYRSEFCILRIF